MGEESERHTPVERRKKVGWKGVSAWHVRDEILFIDFAPCLPYHQARGVDVR
jgi:hypothetical protein